MGDAGEASMSHMLLSPGSIMGAGVPGGAKTGLMKETQSFFSLKKNKTMRLQRWGPWIAYEDQETKQVYWYNQSTSQGQWETPAEVAATKEHQAIVGKTATTSTLNMRSLMGGKSGITPQAPKSTAGSN